jgi:predicted amidophosphoribosyltransferase
MIAACAAGRCRRFPGFPCAPLASGQPAPLDAEFFCVSCRTPFQNRFPLDEEGRCALCRSGLRGFDAAYSFGFYDGVLRQLIHLYKYRQGADARRPFGGPAAAGAAARRSLRLRHRRFRCTGGSAGSADSTRRTCWRGGSPRVRGIPRTRLLRRLRSTASQASLSNTGRRRNVSAAFQCRLPDRAAGRKILLIDDVMTTGSTAAACALALKRAGAARVELLTWRAPTGVLCFRTQQLHRVDGRNILNGRSTAETGAGAQRQL